MTASSNAFQIADNTGASPKKMEAAFSIDWSSEDQNIFRKAHERINAMTSSDKQTLPERADLQRRPHDDQNACSLPPVEIHHNPPTPQELIAEYRRENYNPNEGPRRPGVEDPREAYSRTLAKLSKADCEKIGQIADVISSRDPEKIQALLDSYKDDLATLARIGMGVFLELNRREGKVSAGAHFDGPQDDPTSFQFTVYDNCTGSKQVYRVGEA